MPEISLFYGIRVTMNWNEHNPPHFHVEYGEYRAIVLINESVILKGNLPNKQMKLVLAWNEIHKDELITNWHLLTSGKPMNEIAPLR